MFKLQQSWENGGMIVFSNVFFYIFFIYYIYTIIPILRLWHINAKEDLGLMMGSQEKKGFWRVASQAPPVWA